MLVIVLGVSLVDHVSLPDGGSNARMISQKSEDVTFTVAEAIGAAGGSCAQPVEPAATIQIAANLRPCLSNGLITANPDPGSLPMPCTKLRSRQGLQALPSHLTQPPTHRK